MPFKCVVPGCRSNYYHIKGTASIPMVRYPTDPALIQAWNTAICRPGFDPTPYSHICIKHFRDDQMIPVEFRSWFHQQQKRGKGHFWNRRASKLLSDAVPCVFEVDPSTHKMRPYFRPAKKGSSAQKHQRKRECEILAGLKVEFKPEMWEEEEKKKPKEVVEPPPPPTPPSKRGRGRPRKVQKTDSNSNLKSEALACCALACTNTSENFEMNCLPKDPAQRALWVEKIDRLDWSPDTDSALCEVHFEEDMWEPDTGTKKVLREDAVPSLFLHGEAIKSWVTMDNSGNIADIIVDGRSTNDEESTNGDSIHGNPEESMDCSEQDEDEDPSIFVKREALEPEIDMVEGSEEDMVSREEPSGEQFETIYCDSTFNDHEDSEEGNYGIEEEESPLIIPSSEEENPLEVERSSPLLQDGEVTCLDDSTGKAGNNFYVITTPMPSKDTFDNDKVRRRSSSQLTDEFQCPICDRRLSRRKNLEIHIEKLHPFGETSELHKKRKESKSVDEKDPLSSAKKVSSTNTPTPAFKKPPPALKPIVPQCLLSPSIPTIPIIPLNTSNSLATTSGSDGVLPTSFPIISFSQSPLVSSSMTTPSTTVTQALVASKPLIASKPQPVVAPKAILAPTNLVASSNAGTLISTSSIVTTPRPLDPSPAGGEVRKQFLLLLPKQTVIAKPPPPKKPKPAEEKPKPADDAAMFTVSLNEVAFDKRLKLKDKIRELVDAVGKKDLDPDRIIIAYDRT